MSENVGETRRQVIRRDKGCVAPFLDPEAGPCYDKWGEPMSLGETDKLEMDYVRKGSIGRRHLLAIDHVALCPGHHRGTGPQKGYVWATSHRVHLKEYLSRWRG